MYVFGFNIPILELLVVLSIVVVAYLILLEIEFRQLRQIVTRFDNDESELSKEIQLLRQTIGGMRKSKKN